MEIDDDVFRMIQKGKKMKNLKSKGGVLGIPNLGIMDRIAPPNAQLNYDNPFHRRLYQQRQQQQMQQQQRQQRRERDDEDPFEMISFNEVAEARRPPSRTGIELKAMGRGRGRPRKYMHQLEGDGLWEDMNAWGRQNEANFNKFGRDFENAFRNAGIQMNAWGKRNEQMVRNALSDPRVMAILNDPEIQKLGKAAVKMAVQYIPVIGPPAANVLGLLGFGKSKGRPRKMLMHHQLEGDGLWEDMNAWGRQNEANFNKFGRDFEAAFKNAGVQLNAWGRRNEQMVRNALSDPRVMAILNDPEIQKLGKAAVKMAVQYIPVIGPPAANVLGLLGFGKYAIGGADPREYRRPSHTARALQLRQANERGVEVSDAKGEYGSRTRGTGASGGYVYRPSTHTGAGASGGAMGKRSARAEIVKRIMNERGVSMIDASRIVKSEGLY